MLAIVSAFIPSLLHASYTESAHLACMLDVNQLIFLGKVMKLLKLVFVATLLTGSLNTFAQQGRPNGPPPEAIEACENKSEGDTVSFETRRGDSVEGTCEMVEEQLVAVPENLREQR